MSKITDYLGFSAFFFLLGAITMLGTSLFTSFLLLAAAVACTPPIRQKVYDSMFPPQHLTVGLKLAYAFLALFLVASSSIFRAMIYGPGPTQTAGTAQPAATAKPSPSPKPKATAKPKPKATAKPKQPAKQKPKAPARPATKYSDGSTTAKILAFNIAASHVKGQLKSPSTARFPSSVEKRDSVEHMGGNRYRVNSYVDSQNSFGAMTRTRFVVVVSLFDDGSKIEAFAAE